jgi:hypothetical protein
MKCQLESDLMYEEKPIKILETSERVTRTKTIKFCKVQWSHHTKEEVTNKKMNFEKTICIYLLASPKSQGRDTS